VDYQHKAKGLATLMVDQHKAKGHVEVKFSENAIILYCIAICTAVRAHVCDSKIDTN